MAENKFGIEELGDVTRGLIIQSPPLATVAIASEDTESGYVIINQSDYDADTMTLYDAKPKKKAS